MLGSMLGRASCLLSSLGVYARWLWLLTDSCSQEELSRALSWAGVMVFPGEWVGSLV